MHLPLFIEYEPAITRRVTPDVFETLREAAETYVTSLGRFSHFKLSREDVYLRLTERKELRGVEVTLCYYHVLSDRIIMYTENSLREVNVTATYFMRPDEMNVE